MKDLREGRVVKLRCNENALIEYVTQNYIVVLRKNGLRQTNTRDGLYFSNTEGIKMKFEKDNINSVAHDLDIIKVVKNSDGSYKKWVN